jgi:hypothetical protein
MDNRKGDNNRKHIISLSENSPAGDQGLANRVQAHADHVAHAMVSLPRTTVITPGTSIWITARSVPIVDAMCGTTAVRYALAGCNSETASSPPLDTSCAAPYQHNINQRGIQVAQPLESTVRELPKSGSPSPIAVDAGVGAPARTGHRTPRFFLNFEFNGKHHCVTFAPIVAHRATLKQFEHGIAQAVSAAEKPALLESLTKGYALEFGYWGRTIRRRIRDEAICLPNAAFNAFLNCVRPESVVTIV